MGDVHNRGTKDRPMWYCRYIDTDGKRKHRPTHQPTKALAMRFVAEVEARVARGTSGIPKPNAPEQQARSMTLIGLAQRFLKEAHPPTKNLERYRAWLRYTLGKHVLPELGTLPFASLKAGQVEAFRDRKLADGLSSDEVTKLLGHAREHASDVYPMLATAIYTGMRKGELFGLRWVDVLFERGVIHVAHSYGQTPKSGKWRPVPLHPALAPILRDWKSRCPDGALVFPVLPERGARSRMGTADDMLDIDSLLTAAGCHVPVRPWHAMRHTFASHYVMSGGNLLALQKILGHSKFEMTQISNLDGKLQRKFPGTILPSLASGNGTQRFLSLPKQS
jgi:integrase